MAEGELLRKKIKKNYKFIVKDAKLEELVDGFYSEDVFSEDDRERILSGETTEDKNRRFLDLMFKKNKTKAFKVFIDELHEVKREDLAQRIKDTAIEVETEENTGDGWTVTADDAPQVQVDDKFLLKVAKTFSLTDLNIVATCLGLTSADVDQARLSHPYSPQTHSHVILIKWRNRNSLKTDALPKLLECLKEANSNGAEVDQAMLQKLINDLKYN